jgi:hypothetical protein
MKDYDMYGEHLGSYVISVFDSMLKAREYVKTDPKQIKDLRDYFIDEEEVK